jgi:hypothetical protein
MMFRDMVKSVCGACCAAVVMCASGVWGMDSYTGEDLPRLDNGMIVSYDYEDRFLRDYANSYDKWKADGERFLTLEFVKEYIKTDIAPLLNDGRPELIEWFGYTLESGAFTMQWGSGNVLANAFVQDMLRQYSEHGSVPSYISSSAEVIAHAVTQRLESFD